MYRNVSKHTCQESVSGFSCFGRPVHPRVQCPPWIPTSDQLPSRPPVLSFVHFLLIDSPATQPHRLAVRWKRWRSWWKRTPLSIVAGPRRFMGPHLLGSLCWLHRPTMHRQLGPWMTWPLHQWACSQYFGYILFHPWQICKSMLFHAYYSKPKGNQGQVDVSHTHAHTHVHSGDWNEEVQGAEGDKVRQWTRTLWTIPLWYASMEPWLQGLRPESPWDPSWCLPPRSSKPW